MSAGGFDVSTFADLESFFPANVQVHVGDSVVWKFHGIYTVVVRAERPRRAAAP